MAAPCALARRTRSRSAKPMRPSTGPVATARRSRASGHPSSRTGTSQIVRVRSAPGDPAGRSRTKSEGSKSSIAAARYPARTQTSIKVRQSSAFLPESSTAKCAASPRGDRVAVPLIYRPIRPGRMSAADRGTRIGAGWPQGISPVGLPRIRTCPLGHTGRHVMNSLRDGTPSRIRRDPLLFREHVHGVRCIRHVSLQRCHDMVSPSLHGVARMGPPLRRYYGTLRLPAVRLSPLRVLHEPIPPFRKTRSGKRRQEPMDLVRPGKGVIGNRQEPIDP